MEDMKQLTIDDLMKKHRKAHYKNEEVIDIEHFKKVLKSHHAKISQLARINDMPVSEGALRMQLKRGRMSQLVVCIIADELGINATDLIRKKEDTVSVMFQFYKSGVVGARPLSRGQIETIQSAIMIALAQCGVVPDDVGYYSSIDDIE